MHHYESALTELINQKRSGKPITAKARPKGENVVDLMEALKRSIGNEAQATKGKKGTQGRSRTERNAIAHQR
jgi:DNA end-binding protein Ku